VPRIGRGQVTGVAALGELEQRVATLRARRRGALRRRRRRELQERRDAWPWRARLRAAEAVRAELILATSVDARADGARCRQHQRPPVHRPAAMEGMGVGVRDGPERRAARRGARKRGRVGEAAHRVTERLAQVLALQHALGRRGDVDVGDF